MDLEKDLNRAKTFWVKHLSKFWFIRGFLAALTITSLLPSVIDLSRYELLKAFHAVIVGWDLICEKLGGLIGFIPFVPNIHPDLINGAIFVSLIVLPGMLAFVRIERDSQRITPEKQDSWEDIFPWLFRRKIWKKLAPVGNRISNTYLWRYFSLKKTNFLKSELWTFLKKITVLSIAALFLYMAGLIYLYGREHDAALMQKALENPDFQINRFGKNSPVVPAAIVYIIAPFGLAIKYLRGYRQGLLALLGFIISVEIFYLLGTPYISDIVRQFTEQTLTK